MTVTTRAAAQRSASPQTERISSGPTSRRNSSAKTNESPSEGEGRVRPARKKLAKATIAATEDSTNTEASEDTVAADSEQKPTNGVRGRGLRRKRSFEELGEGQEGVKDIENVSKHSRKRSKDVRDDGERDESLSEASAGSDSASVHSGDERDAFMTSPPKMEAVSDPAGAPPAPPAHESTAPVAQEPAATLAEEPVVALAEESAPMLAEEPALIIVEGPMTPSREVDDIIPAEVDVKRSPPNKRNRDQFTEDHEISTQTDVGDSVISDAVTQPRDKTIEQTSAAVDDEQAPDSKRHRDSFLGSSTAESTEDSTAKIPASSRFADFSAKSPFATLSPKSPTALPQTSPSAFASSGFAALAGTSQSPFGALGSQSVFQKPKEAPQPPTLFGATSESGFAALGTASKSPFATTGPSVFGGSRSGFGQLSNGFGTGSGFGGPLHKPLSSFASSGTASVIGAGSKPAKPFGLLKDDEDEEAEASGAESDGETNAVGAAEEQKDERFYEQEVETGEEDETTEFKGRGKLYMMSTDKQWKERGTGDFKVNSKFDGDKFTARFLMRVDGSHRVVLNSPIKKDLLVEDPQRGPPRGRTAVFLGFVDGRIVTLQLRMRDNVQTLALHDVVKKLQNDM